MATFSERVEEIEAKVTSAETTNAAATAMADTLRDVAAGYMGGDLTMSGTGKSVSVEPAVGGEGEAIVRTAGAYALADGGRTRPVRAYARRRSALNTPWVPKANVSGSTWAGFGITVAASADVFESGKQAIRDAVGVPEQ